MYIGTIGNFPQNCFLDLILGCRYPLPNESTYVTTADITYNNWPSLYSPKGLTSSFTAVFIVSIVTRLTELIV